MSELHVVIAADIFGVGPEFEQLCQQIRLDSVDSTVIKYHVIGPYQSPPDNFSSEKIAYDYFIEQVGVEAYSEKLLSLLETIVGPKLLIGFSVGGSAIWQLMPNLASNQVLSVSCFYSSQIRHMTEVVATVPCRLIFPYSEAHFSITDLIATMQSKEQVQSEPCSYQHGFLNKLSDNYNQCGAKIYIQSLQKLIANTLKSHPKQK